MKYNAIIKKSKAEGKVIAPPSKSMAHRYLIAASISENVFKINNIEYSDDIKATIESLRALNVNIIENENSIEIDSRNFLDNDNVLNKELFANESGSTLRFMIPLCLLDRKKRIIKGSKKLFTRPLDEYIKLCDENGFCIDVKEDSVSLSGTLKEGVYHLSSSQSSQFITGLIFALSYLRKKSTIVLDGEINSKSYINMTLDALNDFGFSIKWENENTIIINDSYEYKKNEYTVEADFSNAAFLDAFNYINNESNVEVAGLNNNSSQGDKIYKKYFDDIKLSTPTLDIKNVPDLAPILIALSSINKGAKLINTSRLKIKESHRGLAMKEELKKLGVDIVVNVNDIIINKSELKVPSENIDSHNDHRIAMAMSVLLSKTGGKIINASAVNKSYPNFYKDIIKLGIEVEYETN